LFERATRFVNFFNNCIDTRHVGLDPVPVLRPCAFLFADQHAQIENQPDSHPALSGAAFHLVRVLARISHRDSGFRDKLARQVGRSAAEA